MKKLLIALVVLVAAVGGGIFYLGSNLGSIVQAAIEKVGGEATQTAVKVGGVDIDATAGTAQISNFVLPNPSGFSDARAFELNKVRVSIDPATVFEDVIVIREILIEQPEVTYEFGDNDSNFVAIQKNVEAFVAKTQQRIEEETGVSTSGGDSAASSSKESSSEGPKIIIEKLSVLRGEVAVIAELLGSREVKTDLPDIVLTDIGKDDGGASPEEIAAILLEKLNATATQAVANLNMDAINGLLQDAGVNVEGLLEGAGNVGAAVGDAVGDALGESGGAVKQVLEGVGEGGGDAAKQVEEKVGGALKGLFGN